jgi:hypothetical protein
LQQYSSWNEIPKRRRTEIQVWLQLARRSRDVGTRESLEKSFKEYNEGYQSLLLQERNVAEFEFIFGMTVCANKLALEVSEPMPSDLRRDLLTKLLQLVDQDLTSRSTLLGGPAIQTLALESMRLDFNEILNTAELDIMVES